MNAIGRMSQRAVWTSGETVGPGGSTPATLFPEGALQAAQVLLAGDLDGAQRGEVRREPLQIDQRVVAEALDQPGERGLPRIGLGVEHRLGREQPADGDAVEAAGEPSLTIPRLDR